MAIHQRRDDEERVTKTIGDTYHFLGEGDTPYLYESRFKIDTDHDIATGGANSVDRKTIYIDRTLYEKVMDGEFKVTNVRPRDIITAWIMHEHSEKCIIDGNNPIERYRPAHQCALAMEHQFVKWLGGNPEKYEEAIWPALEECFKNGKVESVPKDLWCAPLLDEPDERSLELLKRYIKMGVVDASKQPKHEVHYGIIKDECQDCQMWQPDKLSQRGGTLAMCAAVTGLVRDRRGCDLWKPYKGK